MAARQNPALGPAEAETSRRALAAVRSQGATLQSGIGVIKKDKDLARKACRKLVKLWNTRNPGEWKGHPRCIAKGSLNPWRREYFQDGDDEALVGIGSIRVQVPAKRGKPSFWQYFVKRRWESATELVYRNFVKPKGLVVDIGAWIGPTVIYALACRASRVVALEPNPDCFAILQHLSKSACKYDCQLDLLNMAIGDTEGEIMMGMPENCDDTSQWGWQGQDYAVKSSTLASLIEFQDLKNPDLVKIDIEGYEVKIAGELLSAAEILPAVHLSVHVPFFPPGSDVDMLVRISEEYEVFDDHGRQLSHKEFANRVTSTKPFPLWGSRVGNFFSVVLLSRKFQTQGR